MAILFYVIFINNNLSSFIHSNFFVKCGDIVELFDFFGLA